MLSVYLNNRKEIQSVTDFFKGSHFAHMIFATLQFVGLLSIREAWVSHLDGYSDTMLKKNILNRRS